MSAYVEPRHCTGPRAWMAGERRPAPTALIALALEVVAKLDTDDDSGLAVLGDAMLEAGWDHPAIVPMALGVELAPRIPHFNNSNARTSFNAKFERAHRDAQARSEFIAGKSRPWARAALASMLFGDWAVSVPIRYGTRSPWAVIRAWYEHAFGEMRIAGLAVDGEEVRDIVSVRLESRRRRPRERTE